MSIHVLCSVGVSYFVFNEKLDVYGSENQHKEFKELAIQFIENQTTVHLALPLYKIYPTKAYTDFLKVTRAVHQKGKCLYLHILKIFMIIIIGKEILKKRHEQIKDAIASGTVDETKAVGKSCAACDEL